MPTLTKEKEINKLSQSPSEKNLPVVIVDASKKSEKMSPKSLKLLREGLSRLNINVSDSFDDEASIIVLLSEDSKLLEKAWQNGAVPVTSSFDKRIEDYNPNTEKGNCFVFKNFNEWEIFAAVVRALETYKFPYDWKFIKRSCLKSV